MNDSTIQTIADITSIALVIAIFFQAALTFFESISKCNKQIKQDKTQNQKNNEKTNSHNATGDSDLH